MKLLKKQKGTLHNLCGLDSDDRQQITNYWVIIIIIIILSFQNIVTIIFKGTVSLPCTDYCVLSGTDVFLS